MSYILKTTLLFIITAIAEIVGCYLPYLWLREGKSIWLLVPAAFCLALFAWLLTLHNTSAGRTFAAYGGVYVAIILLWMWAIEGQVPDRWDWLGVGIILIGSAVIMFAPHKN